MDSNSRSSDSGHTLPGTSVLPAVPERSYADDEVVKRPLPSIEQLSKAALATHRVCVENSLTHAFFGGFQCQTLGRIRGTKDVDVEIAKPLFGGYSKVFNAFARDAEFRVLLGTRRDAVCYPNLGIDFHLARSHRSTLQLRVIWNLQVGVDIWMRGAPRLPKNILFLNLDAVNSADTHTQLPFFKPKHLLAEKIRCAGERNNTFDGADLLWIMSGPAPNFPPLDPAQVRKLLSDDELSRALRNHPENGAIRAIMGLC